MAVAMREPLRDARRSVAQARLRRWASGSGSRTGYATLGRIGFEGRYDYGAIGMVIIMASRLSSRGGRRARSCSASAPSPPSRTWWSASRSGRLRSRASAGRCRVDNCGAGLLRREAAAPAH